MHESLELLHPFGMVLLLAPFEGEINHHGYSEGKKLKSIEMKEICQPSCHNSHELISS